MVKSVITHDQLVMLILTHQLDPFNDYFSWKGANGILYVCTSTTMNQMSTEIIEEPKTFTLWRKEK